MHIHILGASGSGTSTLGRALASALQAPFFDSDDYYWVPTDPPYRTPLPHDERRAALAAAVEDLPSWIVAGSMMGWGDVLIPAFDLVVYVSITPAARLARLSARERARFGARLDPGGDMHADHQAFMRWAARYDDGGLDVRSRASHARWLELPGCPVLRIDGAVPTAQQVRQVMQVIAESPQPATKSSNALAARRLAWPQWPTE
jgi:adenylate kinase family enzyme